MDLIRFAACHICCDITARIRMSEEEKNNWEEKHKCAKSRRHVHFAYLCFHCTLYSGRYSEVHICKNGFLLIANKERNERHIPICVWVLCTIYLHRRLAPRFWHLNTMCNCITFGARTVDARARSMPLTSDNHLGSSIRTLVFSTSFRLTLIRSKREREREREQSDSWNSF